MSLVKYVNKDGREVLIDGSSKEQKDRLEKAGYKPADEKKQPAPTPKNPFSDESKYRFNNYRFVDEHSYAGRYTNILSNEVEGFLKSDGTWVSTEDLKGSSVEIPSNDPEWKPEPTEE